MKKYLFSLFCLFFIFYSYSEIKTNNWDFNKLNGKVKQWTISIIESNKVSTKKICNFDKDGYMTSREIYDKDDHFIKKDIFIYNTEGLNTEIISYDENDNTTDHIKYQYNEKGLLKKSHILLNSQNVDVDYEYDGNDNLIYMKQYFSINNSTAEYFSKYDDNYNLIEYLSISKTNDGETNSNNFILKYNDLKQKIESSFYINDKIFNITSYKYNTNGDVELETVQYPGKREEEYHIYKYQYDTYNNIILIKKYRNKVLFEKEIHEYIYW